MVRVWEWKKKKRKGLLRMVDESNISQTVLEGLAEEEVIGRPPRRDLTNEWNNMMMSFEKRNIKDFINRAGEVKALVRIQVDDSNKDEGRRIRKIIGASRYCMYHKDFRTCERLLYKAKDILRFVGEEIGSVVVGSG